ncbi:ion transporter [Halomonas sp. PR-M31]|uniref:ion transporter n=1 Tax=Halomonas sp. PR-M31 TaxID=1471202 RepID=UPI000650B48D|nr:ion transporter [Halomonas sp. PR-M31]
MRSTLPPRAERTPKENALLAWDLFIIVLVMLNLGLLIVDSLYLIDPLRESFAAIAPGLQQAYEQRIHDNFYAIDLAFVSIFVLDVLLGWSIAIAERRYQRWFIYPFAHWYDVLGCIPLAGLRWLRILRVFSLIYRLQRLGLIDVRHWSLFQVLAKYYEIALEEISDRVAIRLIDNVQDEIRNSGALSGRLINEIIMPRKEQLVAELTQRLQSILSDGYSDNRALISRYISALVGRTMNENPEIQRLRRLPFGESLTNAVDHTISGVAAQLVHEAVTSLESPEFQTLLQHLADSGFDVMLETDQRTNQITEQVLIDCLELVKDQVAVKQWQQRYD